MIPKDFPRLVSTSYFGEGNSFEDAKAKAGGERYLRLAPLGSTVASELAYMACVFFSPVHDKHFRTQLSLPQTTGKLTPLSGRDFLNWLKKHYDSEIDRHLNEVRQLLRKMEEHSILVNFGVDAIFFMGLERRYFFLKELTRVEAEGLLWLGSALGPQFVAGMVGNAVAHITGVDNNGDHRGGTGIQIGPTAVVTCAHVVTDMILDKRLWVRIP